MITSFHNHLSNFHSKKTFQLSAAVHEPCSYPPYPDLVHNLSDLGFKSHVQHAVGLIQDQVCAASQVGFPRFQEVDESTGCGDTDLHTWAGRGFNTMNTA